MASTTEKKPAVAKKSAPKKPTASKAKSTTTSKPKAVKKVVAKKTAANKTSKTSSIKISAAEHYKMIETASYFIAERHGFAGSSTDYWIAAEAQIKNLLAK